MSFKVVEQEGAPGSTVLIDGETEISGKLAGLVEAGAKIVIKRMSAEFAENLAARCAGNNKIRLAPLRGEGWAGLFGLTTR